MIKFTRKTVILILLIVMALGLSAYTFTGESVGALANGASVYLGGTPIGVIANCKGMLVESVSDVTTNKGKVSPGTDAGLQKGDLILSIDEKEINALEDVTEILKNCTANTLKLKVKRGKQILNLVIEPQIDIYSKQRRLGIHIKNEIAGVGTLTYVRPDNKRFGGLGHQIYDNEKNKDVFHKGNIFKCKIVGVLKGLPEKPGELKGSFKRADIGIGNFDKNNFAGIFGNSEEALYNGRPLVCLGNKNEIKCGKAYVYTTLDGDTPEKYEIEIVKVAFQATPQDKSMVIHVTDPRLLETTGGIVQGMSGSPILQNGKLIGAVTHVFINDPTRGYGIFIDWMCNN